MVQRKFKFIGCEIIYREACSLVSSTEHQVDAEFLQKGLHDLETTDMVSHIQGVIDSVSRDDGFEAILLGYARCNDGLVGVRAREIPLVIPRAHDCITFFFGDRQSYREYFDQSPGTYYLSTGWLERNRSSGGDPTQPAYGKEGVMAKLGLADSYEEMLAKYGKENADYILETVGGRMDHYSRMLYLEMGVCDEAPFIDEGRRRAQERGWEFEHRKGDWNLLRKLFSGAWDDDFVMIPPGKTIVGQNDEGILGCSD